MSDKKKIYIASDHAGFDLKSLLIASVSGFEFVDLGTSSKASVDYPDYAKLVAESIKGNDTYGILLCGSGIGISIAANRYSHIRAALCEDEERAKLARQHNDANVLVLAARFLEEGDAINIVETFFATEFLAGRHQDRVNKI
jgi:ribose 5-phosphate isomerase B